MMISDGNGMQADSIAIISTMPAYPADEMVATINPATSAMRPSSIAGPRADDADRAQGHHQLAALVEELAELAQRAAPRAAARRRRLQHGEAPAQRVARADRLQPPYLVDAGRRDALDR